MLFLVQIALAAAPLFSGSFDAFASRFSKSYANDEQRAKAERCWVQNVARARELTAENPRVTFGESQVSDICWEVLL